MIEKEIIIANKEQFNSTEIAEAAFTQLLKAQREEAITKVRRLVEKEYQTRNELKKAEEVVKKMVESLKKTTDKLTKFKEGDLSVLFEKEEN